MSDELDPKDARIAELEHALRAYGAHAVGCMMAYASFDANGNLLGVSHCECGFWKILATLLSLASSDLKTCSRCHKRRGFDGFEHLCLECWTNLHFANFTPKISP
jgi:hypothetical protein